MLSIKSGSPTQHSSLADFNNIPPSLLERLKLFEDKEIYTSAEDKWSVLRKNLVDEHASHKLNKKFTIIFSNEKSKNYDPFSEENSCLFDKFRNFLHHALASVVLIASLHTPQLRQQLDQHRGELAEILLNEKIATTRLVLKDGDEIQYDAILSGKMEDIVNGNIVFRLGGNNETFEMSHENEAFYNARAGFATFQMNGPGVGRSQGQPSYASIIKSAKVGVKFLETLTEYYHERRNGLKGRIVLKGFSLGNGILSELLRWHKVNLEANDYLVYSVNTFSRLSDVPSGLFSQHLEASWTKNFSSTVCSAGNRLLRWVKFDFDATQASRLLSNLKIPQAILQSSTCDQGKIVAVDDGVISAEASLLNQIVNSYDMDKKLIHSNLPSDSTKASKSTHCIEDRRWSHYLLTNFDQITHWARH